nr:MAG TPA: hypothetical protein [Caudoviricetes sp.]
MFQMSSLYHSSRKIFLTTALTKKTLRSSQLR